MLPILGREPVSRVGDLTGPELVSAAHEVARRLPPGARVAISGSDETSRLIHFLGADLAGCASLLIDPDWPDLDGVLDDARPDVLLDADAPPGPDLGTAVPVGDESTWFYLPTTSGTTGRPKVLARSRGSWLRSFTALGVPLEPGDRVLIPAPLSSSLFLFGALHALHGGADLHLLGRWSVSAAAEATRDATVVHLVPAQLSALLAVLEHDPLLRSRCALRLVVCGGAKPDPALAERLARALPGCGLVEYYGSAEHSLIAVRHDERLMPVVDVGVLDGRLLVRSDLAFDGYLERGELVPASTHWTGDEAVQHPDGALEILGRAGAVIDTGARLVPVEAVESALRAVDGVVDVVVAPTRHPRFGSIVTAVVEGDAQLADLRAHARRKLHPAELPRRWLIVDALPRTASGKPARAVIAERLSSGEQL
ncbi:class I adenylate-forming enzyme family protein [Saccharopolyspora dendranthemae]|uniref:Long-chain acyl-CoA synthetase n=1 Tax=Saccharopolyspora dendranthemae TaxID=1181886 RepID=A0A561U241_9PSEU|nr:AMP-binding protein [Saccharopolyspora dendranthemae]TWF93439.1 long-chain acyl-CoA synthetase [Saccharopolyspora dendranthemae]